VIWLMASVYCVISRGLVAAALLATLVACDSSETPRTTNPVGSPTITPSPTVPSTSSQPVVPAAKDGQNYKACNDGTCEVLIRKKAVLNLRGDKFTATVAAATLKLTDSNGYIALSRNGTDVSRSGGGSAGGVAGGIAAVSWSSQSGPLHIATLTYAEADTVIVSFTTK
jgi:hypothetical protein